ncbi:hypothetical protein ACQKP1_15905 [Allorhizobium sp. NPDC080224]|uniref:hypothetical protein n=1 Tax=Allorhizobium sp. NPDC080224 TaxID=3390547 RepID=UPI003D05149F
MNQIIAYRDVLPEASAKMLTASTAEFSGMDETRFPTALEAFAAAIDAEASGKHYVVRVWVEDCGHVDFPQIKEIYEAWQNEGIAPR